MMQTFTTAGIQRRLDEVEGLVSYCVGHGMEGLEYLEGLTLEEILACWNGIGPEGFPSWLRGLADKVLAVFRPACLIHDVMFARSPDRGREAFARANAVLRRNLLRTADAEYGWYDPRRYRARACARKIADACCAFGWSAWEAAGEGLTEDENLARQKDGDNA